MEASRSKAANLVAWAIPGSLAALLFVLPFPSSVALRNALLSLAVIGVAVLAAQQGGRRRDLLPPMRVWLPIVAWCLWCAASLAWSRDPAHSAGELRPGLLYPAVAFFTFHAATRSEATMERWGWCLAAGLLALGALIVAANLADSRWHSMHTPGGPGAFATHVVLSAPMLVWLFARTPRQQAAARGAILVSGVLALAALWLTDNRISWIALAAMAVLGAWAWRRFDGGSRKRRPLLLLAVVLALLLALFASVLQQRSPTSQESAVAAARELSTDPRVGLWHFSLEKIAEAPWIGHGYGKSILRQEYLEGVKPYHPLNQHGHNTLVNVAVQTGLVGVAIFAWMVLALVRELAAGLRPGSPGRAVAALGLIILAGFAVRNLTDDFLVRHNALLAGALMGAILGCLRARAGEVEAGAVGAGVDGHGRSSRQGRPV